MDLSKLTQQDKEKEVKVNILLEMSTKKYDMQKELESLKVKLSVKESELEKLKRKVVSLGLEVPVIEKQKEIMKEIAENSLRQFLIESKNVEKIQERVWAKINNFISKASAKLEKRETHATTIENPKKCREDKLRQLKVEGEIEAMQLFEKYQAAKIEELKLIKNLLEDDSFERVWAKMNNFVSKASAKLEKCETHSTTIENPKKCRESKLQQLKVEGEIEAMQLFEKYQAAKIEELKLIKNLLEDDSFVI